MGQEEKHIGPKEKKLALLQEYKERKKVRPDLQLQKKIDKELINIKINQAILNKTTTLSYIEL